MLAGCGKTDASDSGKIKIVCTLFPQYDFVRSIVGDRAEVKLLLPAGVESHSYEPTPADVIAISDADLFIYIGDEMETWASSIVSGIDRAKTTVLDISQSLSLTLAGHDHDEADEDEGEHENHVGIDPHIWTSPVIAIKMVEVISDVIIELDKQNTTAHAECADAYIKQLRNLDTDIRTVVKDAKRTEIVFGSRFALKNFADEYGLTHIAAFDSCTDETEPSAAAVAKIVDEVKKNQIPVIFYEELVEPSVAKTLAKETGAKALLFHSCHNLTADEITNGDTYLSLMRQNLANLATALS